MTRRPDRRTVESWALLAVATLGGLALCLAAPHGTLAVLGFLAATAAATAIGCRGPLALPRRALWTAMGVLAIGAVLRAPIGSHDLWSYAMYGRVAAVHHADVYRVAPAHFPRDPVLRLVGRGWRHTTCAYGPVFVAMASVIARLAGTHVVAIRLCYQVPAALAALAGARIAEHTSGDARSAALVGLQPFVWASVVNGGHNDVWVGLAAIVAVVAATRARPVTAGLALAVGALVKSTTLLAAPAIAIWLLARRRYGEAARLTLVTGTVAVVGTALAPRSATGAAHATAGVVTRASIWQVFVGPHGLTPSIATAIGLALTGVIALAAAVAGRHADRPSIAAAVGLAAYTFAGVYVLPWYAFWALPTAAASRRRALAAVLAVHGGLLAATYAVGRAPVAHRFWAGTLTTVVPSATAVVAVAVGAAALRPRATSV